MRKLLSVCLALLLSATLLLALSACTPTSQTATVSARCGETTVTLDQSYGDQHFLKLTCTLTLPETVPPEQAAALIDARLQFFQTATDYAALRAMSQEEAARTLCQNELANFQVNIETLPSENAPHTLTYAATLAAPDHDLTAQPLTLLIGDLDNNENSLLDQPLVISWQPSATGELYQAALSTDGKITGQAELAAYKLHITMNGAPAPDAKTIAIIMQDGTTAPLNGMGSLGNDLSGISWQFAQPLEMDKIATVVIGDQEIPFSDFSVVK